MQCDRQTNQITLDSINECSLVLVVKGQKELLHIPSQHYYTGNDVLYVVS